jgi:hypothetical protein
MRYHEFALSRAATTVMAADELPSGESMENGSNFISRWNRHEHSSPEQGANRKANDIISDVFRSVGLDALGDFRDGL